MSGTSIHPGDEERVAAEMTRQLEAVAADSAVTAPLGFVDRVMAAVAAEPLPQPTRAFGVALLRGQVRAAVASIGDAWRVVVRGATPIGVRAQALALVLVIAIGSTALVGGAVVGAMGLLNANSVTTPAPTTRLPSQPAPIPSPSLLPSPSVSPEASPTTDPSETPEVTETPGDTQGAGGPTAIPTGTDDHGGGSGSGSGPGSGSGSGGSGSDGGGSGSGNSTPKPAETPRPTATGTDDHGGGDG